MRNTRRRSPSSHVDALNFQETVSSVLRSLVVVEAGVGRSDAGSACHSSVQTGTAQPSVSRRSASVDFLREASGCGHTSCAA